MATPINITPSKRDVMVERMLEIKREIRLAIYPNTEYMPHFLLHNPEYSTEEGRMKIRNCWNLTTVSEEMLELFEKLPSQITEQKKAV
jgi:hypothetical protein